MLCMSLDGIINGITTDIRKRTKAALEYAGQKISGDFAVMAYLALDNYYREYEPDFYKRTYQLMDNSYYKVNQRSGFSVNAGIMFNPTIHIKAFQKKELWKTLCMEFMATQMYMTLVLIIESKWINFINNTMKVAFLITTFKSI